MPVVVESIKKALIIIDVQRALCEGQYEVFEAQKVIDRINLISRSARKSGILVVVVQHQAESGVLALNSVGWELARGLIIESTDVLLPKTTADSFHKTELQSLLTARGIKHMVVCGMQSDWLLHQKINRAMAAQDATDRLGGSIQLDDAYLGGELEGGTAGRGSENKVPLVAAVSLDGRGHPRHVKLTIVAGFTSLAIAAWAKAHLACGSSVHSDGLACFAAVVEAGCLHRASVVGRLKPNNLPQFRWINTVLGNLKTTLAGTFHALDYRKYAQGYLSAFAYRFNRRFDLRDLFAQLVVDTAQCQPIRETTVRHGFAEAGC